VDSDAQQSDLASDILYKGGIRQSDLIRCHVDEPGQVLCLLMCEGGGSLAKDYSGLSNHGEIHGPKWTDEPTESESWTLDFDGDDDYVRTPPFHPQEWGEFTVMGWMCRRTNDTWDLLSGLENRAWWLGGRTGYNDFAFVTTDDAGNSDFYYVSGFDLGEWIHAAYVYDGSYKKMYKNGKLLDSKSYSVTLASVTEKSAIGANYDGTDYFFDGFIDWVMIYDHALPEGKIRTIYEDTKPLYTD